MELFLEEIIRTAGGLARDYFFKGVNDVRTKSSPSDLVTEADYGVNDFLVKHILQHYPDHRIHSEELREDINPSGRYEWVIDPIDGTRNFAMGVPFWCILMALLKEGQPYLAAVYNPVADQLFSARAGGGALLNGHAIQVNSASSLDFSFACISYDPNKNKERSDRFKQLVTRFTAETTGRLYNYGTMLPACHVGTGGIDVFATNSGYDHD